MLTSDSTPTPFSPPRAGFFRRLRSGIPPRTSHRIVLCGVLVLTPFLGINSIRAIWRVSRAESAHRVLRQNGVSTSYLKTGFLHNLPTWGRKYCKTPYFINGISDQRGYFKSGDDNLELLNLFPDLQQLSLCAHPLDDQLISVLQQHPPLRSLCLYNSNATDAQLRAISSLSRLRVLLLGHSHLTDEGLQALAAFPDLEELYLDSEALTGQGFVYLRQLKHLKRLTLYGKKIDDHALKILADELHDSPLESLVFHRTSITENGKKELLRFQHLKQPLSWEKIGKTLNPFPFFH